MKQKNSSKRIWLSVLAWTALIFYMSLNTGEDSGALSGNITKSMLDFLSSLGIHITFESAHHFIRKAAHFSEYAVLGLLVCNAQKKAPLLLRSAQVIFLWMVLVPALDETLQHFVPGRYGALSDVLLDACGYAFAAGLFTLFTKRKASH